MYLINAWRVTSGETWITLRTIWDMSEGAPVGDRQRTCQAYWKQKKLSCLITHLHSLGRKSIRLCHDSVSECI
jgi:hypothetical protein